MKDLSLHLVDLVQNALEAKSSDIKISVEQSRQRGLFIFTITDNGKGMEEAFLKDVTDPFSTTRTQRHVGMGLSLMKQNAERTGGSLAITSTLGIGTTVTVTLHHQHIDALPLGRWSQSVAMLISADENVIVDYKHTTDQGAYHLSSEILQEILGDLPLGMPKVMAFVQEMIAENLEAIDVFEGLI